MPFEQHSGFPGAGGFGAGGGPPGAGQGPLGDWLGEAGPRWPQQQAWPAPRFDLDPPRERLSALGAVPWVVAGLLAAYLLVGREPAPTPVSVAQPLAVEHAPCAAAEDAT